MTDISFKKTLVALDNTLMDEFVIEYLSHFSSAFGIRSITFLHVLKELDTHTDLQGVAQAEQETIDELSTDLKEKVAQYPFGDVTCEVVVKKGSPTDVLLKYAVSNSFDLMVMGRKRSLKGSGIVSGNIARSSPTSILFVTQNMNPSLNRILVPVDFSEHASMALAAGVNIKNQSDAKVGLINIYDVPVGYYKLGKSYEEFSEIMRGHAKNDLTQFLKKHSFDQSFDCQFADEGTWSKIDIVFEHAISSRSDLIIIGSQGRTNASAIFLGSFAEKMVFRDTDIPILIIKKEGENMSLLQALMSI